MNGYVLSSTKFSSLKNAAALFFRFNSSVAILKLCIYLCVMATEVSLPKRKHRLWNQLGQHVWLCQYVGCPLFGFSGQSCPFMSFQRRHPSFGWRPSVHADCSVATHSLEETEISKEAKLQLAEANVFLQFTRLLNI